MKKIVISPLLSLPFPCCLVLIYRRGRENKAWVGQGIRFGLLWACAAVLPMYMIYHAVMPYELDLTAKQIGFDSIAIVLLGLVVAAVNRD